MLNERDGTGLTPLHWAAKRGEDDFVELLLCFDADVHAEDLFGRVPLDLAKNQDHKAIIELIGSYERGTFAKNFEKFHMMELFGKFSY